MSLKFENIVAVVTGASSGIGRAIAHALAGQGAQLCLVGRNAATLDGTGQSAPNGGGRFTSYVADLSRREDVETLVARLGTDHRAVDILVHCAGAFPMGTVESTTMRELDETLETNFRAPYVLTKGLLTLMKPRRPKTPSQIVFVNSLAGLAARGGIGTYSASKYALRALADSLREEVNGEGIRILSVYPGRTDTPMLEDLRELEGEPYDRNLFLQPEDVASVVVHALTLPPTAEVTDISIQPFQRAG